MPIKVYKWNEPVPDDGEKFFLPSRTDPSGYESLEDFIKRSMDPEFIPDLIRQSATGEGYSPQDVVDHGDEILADGPDLQDREDFDLADVTENQFVLGKAAVAARKKQGDDGSPQGRTAKKFVYKKVEPDKNPVSKDQGASDSEQRDPEETPDF